MAKGWRFYLHRSVDFEDLGHLKDADDRLLSVDLNKSGSSNCTSPMADKIAKLVYPWSTCIVAQHDDDIYWSGPVVTRARTWSAGKMTIGAQGWFERLMHIQLQGREVFVNEDAGEIVSVLLERAHDQDHILPITLGTVELTQTRTVTYEAGQSIGQAIIDLCELEAGFDWFIHPVTRELNIVTQIGQRQDDCKWTFIGDGKNSKSNLSELEDLLDGSTVVNRMRAVGKIGSGYADDPRSLNELGTFDDRPSLSDVSDPNILNAYANAEIVYRAWPRFTFSMTPKVSTKPNVPKLFRDFDIGDVGFLTARRDEEEILDQACRMFGATLAISPTGSETITNLQTTAS